MKATGIVRRVDDLGRVVIPKEIRRSMKIKEGDPLEIFTSDEGVTFRKYNPVDEEKWELARDVLACYLTKGFELLDTDNEVKARVGAPLQGRTSVTTRQVQIDGWDVGYIVVWINKYSQEELSTAAKMVAAILDS